jgi:4-hydroxybenzoate polyprenyltransferase
VIGRILREIRIEHTLFALPFAYVGAVLAARGLPTLYQFIWITLAVLGARTAAMAANRYVDRDIDARNPRTARRALAAGTLAPSVMLWTAAGGLVLLVVSAAMLNWLCVALLPVAALGIALYPFCKRFTWGAHFVLGAVDGLAPLGAYIAVSGRISLAAILMFAAVTIWVAGFDVIYALMDRDVDVAQDIRSIPARFGADSGRRLPLVLHALMVVLLGLAGVLAQVGPLYYLGVLAAAVLAWYEGRLFVISKNLFVLNERVFVSNMAFSVSFLAATLGGFAWRA